MRARVREWSVAVSFAALVAGGCGDDGGGASGSGGLSAGSAASQTTTAATTEGQTTGEATTAPTSGASGSSGGLPGCGDGMVDPGEACDDGNQVDGDACTNACAAASCGDGTIDAGEECDDGNQDDNDMCLGTCKAAMCGDMVIHLGFEECDDGNAEDNDACVAGCQKAKCGDGFVQAGVEPCDDGNQDDNDACLVGCVAAKCGDGLIQTGVEACDDGNMSDADSCTSLCKAPSCVDMLKDGSESDVDCGGACPKCDLGQGCTSGLDCTTGFCATNKCDLAPSCKVMKESDANVPSGVYSLDPDGVGPGMPFQAYCDMTTDGGGWTLALKADGNKTTFPYAAALWTDNSLYQPNFPDLDRKEAKLQTWNTIAFTELLIGMESPIGAMGPLNLKTQKLPVSGSSLFAVFSPNALVLFNVGRAAWKALITDSSLQPNCNREGINNDVPGYSRTRIGILSNQENECASPDSYIGIGNAGAPCGPQPERAVGNIAGCSPDNGDKNLPAFGVVLVR